MNREVTALNKQGEVALCGTVENVVFRNNDNGFTVLEINNNGELLSAVGVLSDTSAGEEVVLHGRWTSHDVFGRQFKIESCERKLPDTAAKLFRYLAAGSVKGVGPKLAAKITERFGEDTFDVLENENQLIHNLLDIESGTRQVLKSHHPCQHDGLSLRNYLWVNKAKTLLFQRYKQEAVQKHHESHQAP